MRNRKKLQVSFLKEKYNKVPVQAKLAMWLMICTLIQRGISLITVPLYTRLMSLEEYGYVSTYFSWVSIALILSSFKLNAGVYNKGLSKFKEDRDGYCLSMQYTTSVITVFLLLLYVAFHKWVNDFMEMSTGIILFMFVELFFSTSMGFWTVKEQYDFHYKPIVRATMIYALLNLILGLIFVINAETGTKGYARIFSVVVVQAIVGGFFYMVNMKRGKFRFNLVYSVFAVKFNIPLIPHYFSEYILNQSDRIMIQKLCNYSDVALYSVAYNAGMLLTIITSSINQALTPWIYQSLDEKNFKQINKVILSIAIVIMIPIIIFIAVAPEAIYILAGKQYSEAVYVVPPVAGSIVFLFLYTVFANVEFYYDYNKFTMYISLVGAVFNIILNYFFIKLFGFVAAGYTTFICYFVYCVGHYLFMNYIVKKREQQRIFDSKALIGLFVGLLIMMILMSMTYNQIIVRYGIIVVITVVSCLKRRELFKVIRYIKK